MTRGCGHYWVDVSAKWERCRTCLAWRVTPERYGQERQRMFQAQRREIIAQAARRRARQGRQDA